MRVLVTVEAMAAGAVVVVSTGTAVWGAGDLVQDGTTGLVYRSGDVDDLACQLLRLQEQPDLLKALRSNAARRSVDFGPAAFAQTMADAVLTRIRK
jgi:glycosyltransferase involved in cell wall biosynthesis